LMIVPDQVAHQNVDDVIVDRDGATKAGHGERIAAIPINGQHFCSLTTGWRWTHNQTST
jgi:hypothetical protein